MKSVSRYRKDHIRYRDRRTFAHRGRCVICGASCATHLHHFYYSDVYDERSFVEVCPPLVGTIMSACHKRFHS